MMNPEIKREWVARLRSGRYAQGHSALHNVRTNTFCCLGVLCEIAADAGVVTRKGDGSYVSKDDEFLVSNVALLPFAVVDWASVEGCNPNIRIPGTTICTLSRANDNGVTF